MIEPSSLELFAYLKREGIDKSELQLAKHSHNASDLVDGVVDAMSIYTTDEPFYFSTKGIGYQLFRPIMGGIDFYGDNLFTTLSMFENHTETVKNFRKASLKGWKYAMQYPEEIIQLIVSRYSDRKSIDHLRFEAQKMQELMQPSLIEVGYSNPGRWEHIAHTFSELGLVPGDYDVSSMLYMPNVELKNQQLIQKLYILGATLAVVFLFFIVYYRQYRLATIRHHQFKTIFHHAPVSLIEIDRNGIVKNWNQCAAETFKFKPYEAIGHDIAEIVSPSISRNKLRDIFEEACEKQEVVKLDNSNMTKEGEEILCEWTNVPFESSHTRQQHLICAARDITKEKQLEQELYRAAKYDELTQVPNRSLIVELLKESIADARREKQQLAILFLDLNGFKKINDRYGHQVGDKVLSEVAKRLESHLRENDLIGRLAGDEFLIIIKNHHDEAALQLILTKLQGVIEKQIRHNDLLIQISASIGFSIYPRDAVEIQELISIADQQMYKVKSTLNKRQQNSAKS